MEKLSFWVQWISARAWQVFKKLVAWMQDMGSVARLIQDDIPRVSKFMKKTTTMCPTT